jgi:hypothetical protein
MSPPCFVPDEAYLCPAVGYSGAASTANCKRWSNVTHCLKYWRPAVHRSASVNNKAREFTHEHSTSCRQWTHSGVAVLPGALPSRFLSVPVRKQLRQGLKIGHDSLLAYSSLIKMSRYRRSIPGRCSDGRRHRVHTDYVSSRYRGFFIRG